MRAALPPVESARMQGAPSRGIVQLVAGTEGRWQGMTAGEGVLRILAELRWPLVCYTRAWRER